MASIVLSLGALLAVIANAAPTFPVATLDGYALHVWHAEDGLPEETVQSFAQTRDHFLWIGTSGGLVRFDGAQFVVFNRDNTRAFRENSVFCLLASTDGELWIGTEGGGLIEYAHDAFQSWTQADGLTNGYIRSLQQDESGDIWIGTDDGSSASIKITSSAWMKEAPCRLSPSTLSMRTGSTASGSEASASLFKAHKPFPRWSYPAVPATM